MTTAKKPKERWSKVPANLAVKFANASSSGVDYTGCSKSHIINCYMRGIAYYKTPTHKTALQEVDRLRMIPQTRRFEYLMDCCQQNYETAFNASVNEIQFAKGAYKN